MRQLAGRFITATQSIYTEAMLQLLPTPSKSHYVFNLRDFARVVQVGLRGGFTGSSHVQVNSIAYVGLNPGQSPIVGFIAPGQWELFGRCLLRSISAKATLHWFVVVVCII